MGLLHRVQGTDALHDSNANLRTSITAELVSGMPAQHGQEYMWRHLSIRRIPVARDRMFAIMKELDPDAVAARKSAFKAGHDRVGKYLVPGPDYVWSVDGHLKFRDYGIGIYPCNDGYSRYITSIHVGLSVTCAVIILRDYLDVLCGNDDIRPTIIRADRGTQTMLMANA
jgi:transposase InsO family protein